MASQPQAGGNAGGKRRRPRPGFSNVYSMNDQPPPPPPRNDRPNVPPQPPRPDQGTQPPGPRNLGGPSQTGGAIQQRIPPASPPVSGVSSLQGTGIFNLTGIGSSEMDKLLEDDSNMPDTPSRTNEHSIAQLQGIVESAKDDEDLLALFRNRVDNVSQGQTIEERKHALRTSVQPWITSGLSYTGPKRPGLFLADGTRNSDRPPRGAGGGPGTATTGSQGPTPGAGNPPSGPVEASTGPKASPPAGGGNKSSTGTGTSSSGARRPQSAGGGKKSSTSTRPQPTAAGKKSTGPGTSPLRNPPLLADDVPDPGPETSAANSSGTGRPDQTDSGWDGPAWYCRDDLFADGVMDAAGITWFPGGENVDALPTLASTIEYNTENWG